MAVDVVSHCGKAHTQHISEGPLVVPARAPSLHGLSNIIITEDAFAAPGLPRRSRGPLASKAAFSDQLPLKLSKSAQHVQEHAALRRICFDGLGKAAKAYAANLEAIEDAGEMENKASKAIQLVDDKDVPLLHGCKKPVQLRTLLHCRCLLLNNALYSGPLECGELRCCVLLSSAYAGIAIDRHLST